jgi:hypothetical protein
MTIKQTVYNKITNKEGEAEVEPFVRKNGYKGMECLTKISAKKRNGSH